MAVQDRKRVEATSYLFRTGGYEKSNRKRKEYVKKAAQSRGDTFSSHYYMFLILPVAAVLVLDIRAFGKRIDDQAEEVVDVGDELLGNEDHVFGLQDDVLAEKIHSL